MKTIVDFFWLKHISWKLLEPLHLWMDLHYLNFHKTLHPWPTIIHSKLVGCHSLCMFILILKRPNGTCPRSLIFWPKATSPLQELERGERSNIPLRVSWAKHINTLMAVLHNTVSICWMLANTNHIPIHITTVVTVMGLIYGRDLVFLF